MTTLILAIHIIICVFLIVVVLMQSSRENELSGLFMSGGSGQPLFGPRSGNILTRITTILAIGFMVTSITLTILSARRPRRVIDKILSEEKREIPQPIPTPAPESLPPEETSEGLPR